MGFGAGCNLGAMCASSYGLLFLNPDFYLDQDRLTKFISNAVNLSSKNFYVPLSNNEYWDLTLEDTFIKRISTIPSGESTQVSFLSGSCFFCERQLFLTTGGFDESIFMYCEDLELSLRLKAQNIKVHLLPFNIGKHVGGGSFRTKKEKMHRLLLSFSAHRKVLRKLYTEPFLSIIAIYLSLGIR